MAMECDKKKYTIWISAQSRVQGQQIEQIQLNSDFTITAYASLVLAVADVELVVVARFDATC